MHSAVGSNAWVTVRLLEEGNNLARVFASSFVAFLTLLSKEVVLAVSSSSYSTDSKKYSVKKTVTYSVPTLTSDDSFPGFNTTVSLSPSLTSSILETSMKQFHLCSHLCRMYLVHVEASPPSISCVDIVSCTSIQPLQPVFSNSSSSKQRVMMHPEGLSRRHEVPYSNSISIFQESGQKRCTNLLEFPRAPRCYITSIRCYLPSFLLHRSDAILHRFRCYIAP